MRRGKWREEKQFEKEEKKTDIRWKRREGTSEVGSGRRRDTKREREGKR